MTLERNVCGADKSIRLMVGFIFLAVGIFADVSEVWRIALLLIAATAMFTAFSGYCPLSKILGRSSCGINSGQGRT